MSVGNHHSCQTIGYSHFIFGYVTRYDDISRCLHFDTSATVTDWSALTSGQNLVNKFQAKLLDTVTSYLDNYVTMVILSPDDWHMQLPVTGQHWPVVKSSEQLLRQAFNHRHV
jgi:hypothetical protein